MWWIATRLSCCLAEGALGGGVGHSVRVCGLLGAGQQRDGIGRNKRAGLCADALFGVLHCRGHGNPRILARRVDAVKVKRVGKRGTRLQSQPVIDALARASRRAALI